MSDHAHHSEPIRISPSILRASVGNRLMAVAILLAALWAGIFWAMG